jgi:putative transposase
MREAEVRYNYRLRVRPAQAAALQGVFDTCRFVWNQALGRWSDLWREEGESLLYRDADRELTDWRSRFEWLAEKPSVPQQQVLRDLYRAISAFFDKTNPAGRPDFKRKGTYATARWTRQAFSLTGTGSGIAGEALSVATGAGRIQLRVVWSRRLPSKPSSVTVYRDSCGRYFASFVCRIEVPDAAVEPHRRSTGIDLGISTYATACDPAHDVANPRHLRQAAKALARSQRSVSTKQKASAGRAQARRTLTRRASTVARARLDFQHKAARGLVATYDRIGVEDLRVKNMSRRGRPGRRRRKAGLNASIADASWAQFIRVLEHQAKKAGAEVLRYPAANTTQRCSECGSITKTRLALSDRVFRCDVCGLEMDRDRNAARNLDPDHPRNRLGCSGAGDDGSKTRVPAGTRAA